MSSNAMTSEDIVKSVEKTEVNEEIISKYKSEDELTGLAFELLKEIAKVVVVLSSVVPTDDGIHPRKWNRDEAILGGMLIRIGKLQKGILGHTMERQRELAVILMRCLAETAINFQYLIHNNSKELFDAYVEYSLRTEKRLLLDVEERTERDKKGDNPLLPAINERMKKSILFTFEKSGMKPDQVDEKKKEPWGGKNLYQKTEEIGYEYGYRALFSLPSHNIHGNWQDIFEYHVEPSASRFSPWNHWHRPRPQYLFVAALLSASACHSFIDFLPDTNEKETLRKLVSDLFDRTKKADFLHETFLQAAKTPQ